MSNPEITFTLGVEQETVKVPAVFGSGYRGTGRYRVLLTIKEGCGGTFETEWFWAGPWHENVVIACLSLDYDAAADPKFPCPAQFEAVREQVTRELIKFLNAGEVR